MTLRSMSSTQLLATYAGCKTCLQIMPIYFSKSTFVSKLVSELTHKNISELCHICFPLLMERISKKKKKKQYDCDNSTPGLPDYRQNFSCNILSNIKLGGGEEESIPRL